MATGRGARVISIEVQNVTKRVGAFTAFDGLGLNLPTGKLVALLGSFGSGRTSLLPREVGAQGTLSAGKEPDGMAWSPLPMKAAAQ